MRFRYGTTVKVTDKDSFYYGSTGRVKLYYESINMYLIYIDNPVEPNESIAVNENALEYYHPTGRNNDY